MSVSTTAYAKLRPTGLLYPLPNAKWFCYITATGDASGGNIDLWLKAESAFNNPFSVESFSIYGDTTTRYGYCEVLDHVNYLANAFRQRDKIEFDNNGQYGTRKLSFLGYPFWGEYAHDTYCFVRTPNVSALVIVAQAWGYLWQPPLGKQPLMPWAPAWGTPPVSEPGED